MHNWRLLILAFFAVLQPIASFTERNLVDGREQCCDRQPSLPQYTRLSYGIQRLSKPPSEDRRLSLGGNREDRRYEVRKDDSVLTSPTADRRLIEYRSERVLSRNSPELSTTFTRVEHRRFRATNDQQRERLASEGRDNRIRDTRRIFSRDITRNERNRDIARHRYSRDVDVRQYDHEIRESSRVSRDNRVRSFNTERQSRIMMDSQRETRQNREGSGDFYRSQEVREIRNLQAREDVARSDTPRDRQSRRIVRERMDERRAFTTRSESRLQLDNIRERRSLDRIRDDLSEHQRSSTLESRTDNRVRLMREESRGTVRVRDDTRDERRQLKSRQAVERVDERRQQRVESKVSTDRAMALRRESRETPSVERRVYRKSADRSRSVDTQFVRSAIRNIRDNTQDERRHLYSTRAFEEVAERQQRDENRVSKDRLMAISRESRETSSVDRRLNRESIHRYIRFERSAIRNVRDDTRETVERADDRRQRDENRISRDRSMAIRRESRDASAERRLSRESSDRSRNVDRRNANERVDERRQQRNENRISRIRSMTIRRESRETSSVERKLSRKSADRSRNVEIRNVRFERAAIRKESRNDERQFAAEPARNRDNVENRRERSSERPAFRENRHDARLIRSNDASQNRRGSPIRNVLTRNMERRIEYRFRFNEITRTRENFASIIREKTQNEEQTTPMNWQYLFYTLQGIYLCSILMQILAENGSKKKLRISSFWTMPTHNLIKVD